ncbi:MAG: PepSY domain-containing protein [Bacteroidota bacterium]
MKKLRGLGNKNYNVLFHTHTVVGIVISFALFVIFYAGAFSLFRHEIGQWENPDMRQPVQEDFDLDAGLATVDDVYHLNYYENTNIWLPSEDSPVMYVYGAFNDTDSTTERMAAYISPVDMHIQDVQEPLTTVNTTIYYLHYFRQIPVVGLYIAGFVALFFLFAIVTGVLIHWRNILTKFYAFVKEAKWKVIWTNAHTVLGVIGLPFQIIYAITGAFFGLLTFILLPTVFLLYEGDQEKVLNKVNPASALTVDENAPAYDHHSLTDLYAQLRQEYPDYTIRNVLTRNYGKQDALAFWNLDNGEGINARGSLAMRLKDGVVLEEYSIIPERADYTYSIINFIFKLHFGSFGGYSMRVIYFVLSMITCFMIISGILIWRTARDTDQYTYKQRLFHHNVTKWYLAICLSLYPAFALLFLLNKLVPMDMVGRVGLVNGLFFGGWLAMTLIGLFWNKYAQQNRNYLIMGGAMALLIPIVNGVVTGGWIWEMWSSYHWVAYVDMFWLIAGLVSLYLSFVVLKVKDTTDKPQYDEGKGEKDVVQPRTTVKSRPKLKPQLVGFSRNVRE